jgi:hypothetical protein
MEISCERKMKENIKIQDIKLKVPDNIGMEKKKLMIIRKLMLFVCFFLLSLRVSFKICKKIVKVILVG